MKRDDPPIKLLMTLNLLGDLDRIEACLDNLEVRVSIEPNEIMELIPDAEVACVGVFDAGMLRAASRLRWVQAFSGGIEGYLFPAMAASPVMLTCLKGCFNIAAAEYALGVMLAFAKRIEYDMRRRPYRTFQELEITELHGKTVGIIGLGEIGTEVARRCKCFGMRVIGLSRRRRQRTGEVDEALGLEELPQLLGASDFIVVAVPSTPYTRGLIGEAELAAMKDSAYLVDVSGRTALYDLDALASALKSGKLAGASLQTELEPDSPLWGIEALLISYHRTVSVEQYDRAVEMFCENLRRYRENKPLLGLVDKEAGY